MINIRKMIIIFSTVILIVSGGLFSNTKGLRDASDFGYVSETFSSSSDDNFCIEASTKLFIIFIFFCFTLKKRFAIWEFITGNIVLFLQLFLLIAIESGSLILTIKDGNIPLIVWIASYIFVFIEIYVFFIYEHFFSRDDKMPNSHTNRN
ncbi:MAG: hypothetical protein E7059_09705 [Treponema bryantii]|nr:hypothetical protein [Treponema bryantii]